MREVTKWEVHGETHMPWNPNSEVVLVGRYYSESAAIASMRAFVLRYPYGKAVRRMVTLMENDRSIANRFLSAIGLI